jgi:iron(II)-dependent oxidoreductase
VISELSKSSLKEFIFHAFHQCRAKTLTLFEGMDEVTFRYQAHPDFSPVGWHLGHIAYTESLWLLERSVSKTNLFPQYRKLFAADGLPKTERIKLPTLQEVRYFLDTVREKVLDYLKVVDLEHEERLWRFLLQHESQHSEIITFLLELHKIQHSTAVEPKHRLSLQQSKVINFDSVKPKEMVEIPPGEFEMGNNSIDALDNERPSNKVYLNTYWIDTYPVTCREYQGFMEAGGYQNSLWWSESGWEWLQREKVNKPLYWCDNSTKDNHPVCGVSWYEAEAYSRFVGKELPTEAEWEKAVSWDEKFRHRRIYPWEDEELTIQHCNYDNQIGTTTPVDTYPLGRSAYGVYDTLGNVWEWTASWFNAYDGFEFYPYKGYSQVYFDSQHRVLKGGSWATRSWALRSSFRNWYLPSIRQIFAGFRCVIRE